MTCSEDCRINTFILINNKARGVGWVRYVDEDVGIVGHSPEELSNNAPMLGGRLRLE